MAANRHPGTHDAMDASAGAETTPVLRIGEVQEAFPSLVAISSNGVSTPPANLPVDGSYDGHPSASSPDLGLIEQLDADLTRKHEQKLVVDASFSRHLVSFQANKSLPGYRWFKFKEAFSAPLIEYLLARFGIRSGRLLDPFAGSGTALFTAAQAGLDAEGIELLPVGQFVVDARRVAYGGLQPDEVARLNLWASERPWLGAAPSPLNELRITRGAYSAETEDAIRRCLGAIQHEPHRVQTMLRFALLCVLESVSYTRKDGQYLRWDSRAGRTNGGKRFHKGSIPTFESAFRQKVGEITADAAAWRRRDAGAHLPSADRIRLFRGSCLDILPVMQSESYDVILTSPPYCNRYDYTRTYALELALLGISETEIVRLRQDMLSCTVENRAKDLLAMNPAWTAPVAVADRQPLLQAILSYLEAQRTAGKLNNNGIPRMVRGYFYEMACVIAECSRVARQGARFIMVNDNVRYAGASISVDLLLSEFAEQLGFELEHVFVLPVAKGNSSQQMGAHGRDKLRKCIYVWRRA